MCGRHRVHRAGEEIHPYRFLQSFAGPFDHARTRGEAVGRDPAAFDSRELRKTAVHNLKFHVPDFAFRVARHRPFSAGAVIHQPDGLLEPDKTMVPEHAKRIFAVLHVFVHRHAPVDRRRLTVLRQNHGIVKNRHHVLDRIIRLLDLVHLMLGVGAEYPLSVQVLEWRIRRSVLQIADGINRTSATVAEIPQHATHVPLRL